MRGTIFVLLSSVVRPIRAAVSVPEPVRSGPRADALVPDKDVVRPRSGRIPASAAAMPAVRAGGPGGRGGEPVSLGIGRACEPLHGGIGRGGETVRLCIGRRQRTGPAFYRPTPTNRTGFSSTDTGEPVRLSISRHR
ncbi:hypothetical protein ABB55_09210 [Prosthecomicrobium hirschii]|uniref:Uncharacterized protein n=1 Tax=Prosthecodimorpha hirschii TaxID=665126 RepID=A0A0P6WCH1_9HYPH|nr:hypothetical protein ABB55_09210 [Prosthecomicrobium hirschii]